MRKVALLLMVSGIFGAGCTSAPDAGALRMQINAEPVSLDPSLAEDGVSLKILDEVMDGLVGYDGSGKLVPRLARSYDESDAGKTYRFHLRSDAKWSDGRPVSPADFVTAFRRALAPATPNKLVSLFFPIRGAREFHEGKATGDQLGVRADGDTVVFELAQPAGYFLQALTLAQAVPQRQDVLDSHQGKWPEDAPCTGPYRIASHVHDQKIVLERNAQSIAPAGGPSSVTILIVPDETTAANLFEQGRIDILTRVPTFDFEKLKRQGVIHVDPFVATYYVAFNVSKPPFDDPQLRRAVAASIRKDEITAALGTGETPARSWIPPGIEGFQPYVPTLAGPLLVPKDRPSGPIAVAYDTNSRNTLILEKIQQDVKKGLGLQLSLNNLDWKSYIKMVQTDAPPMFRFGMLAPFIDPITHLRAFTTGDRNNYSHFSNAEYDRLVEEISTAVPGLGRQNKLRRAQAILLDEEAVVVPIYHYVQTHAVSPKITGFRVNPFGVIHFEELTLKP